MTGPTAPPAPLRVHLLPVVAAGEVACSRELCGDGYTQHVTRPDGLKGPCAVCLCAGFQWVQA